MTSPVVHDHEGNVTPGVLQLPEEVPDPGLEQVARDSPEERRDPRLAVHEHSGRAAADRVDAGEMVGGSPQRLVDLPEVPEDLMAQPAWVLKLSR